MKKKQKNQKINKFFTIISILLVISAVVATGFLIYFEIIPILYLSLFIIIGGILIFILFKLLNTKKLKKWIRFVITIPCIVLIVGFTLVCFYSYGTIDFFNNIFDTGIRHDNFSVYVLKDSKYENIDDLSGKIISVSDKDEITKKAIDKVSNKIEFNEALFDNISEASESVFDNESDAVLALDSNIEVLKEEDDRYNNLKAIYSFSITSKVKTLASRVDVSKDNFVLYISGIDTNGKVSAKARSDVNIIVAVNPKEKKILMVNTPRDYYVMLHSKKAMDKLTHAGVYGIEESVGTLEDLYDIKIDYYARVNFTTFINIVEKLDGVEVDVPVNFCEQTSSRTSSVQICLKKGLQTLNGEQALALARTRHTLSGGDRARGSNQMLVLEAIFNKAISPSIIVKYNSLLNSVSDSVITNVDQKAITKLIKKQIKDNTSWEIESYSVDGSDSSNVTYSTGRSKAYVMIPKEETVDEAKIKLDKILGTKKYTTSTTTTTTKKAN